MTDLEEKISRRVAEIARLQNPPDPAQFTLDHFYVKLFKTAETLKTAAGKAEGLKRAGTMRKFLEDLRTEI